MWSDIRCTATMQPGKKYNIVSEAVPEQVYNDVILPTLKEHGVVKMHTRQKPQKDNPECKYYRANMRLNGCVPGRLRIARKELESHGYIENCLACETLAIGADLEAGLTHIDGRGLQRFWSSLCSDVLKSLNTKASC